MNHFNREEIEAQGRMGLTNEGYGWALGIARAAAVVAHADAWAVVQRLAPTPGEMARLDANLGDITQALEMAEF